MHTSLCQSRCRYQSKVGASWPADIKLRQATVKSAALGSAFTQRTCSRAVTARSLRARRMQSSRTPRSRSHGSGRASPSTSPAPGTGSLGAQKACCLVIHNGVHAGACSLVSYKRRVLSGRQPAHSRPGMIAHRQGHASCERFMRWRPHTFRQRLQGVDELIVGQRLRDVANVQPVLGL